MAAQPQHKPGYRTLRTLLRCMREEAGLTQRDLAAKLRMHNSMVHRSETGDRRIDPVEFVAWCRACGCDPAVEIARLG
ncbi:MAG: helix-turn-helix transcriptional regulator [Planctomycetes bacterium]|nr:helix-turn-helix transcriptional regulator [Planctomycetota bacterium]MCB9918606.1 helix-turn-helix transcriptional regulator [Planctomycetota bacterium]